MKSIRLFIGAVGLVISALALHSCNDNEYYDYGYLRPTALVTVRPQADGTFFMQLDDFSVLYPENMSESPFGDKEVRALVSYREVKPVNDYYTKSVAVNWIDSILTKPAVPYPADGDVSEYGDDPIEIVRDWVNIAEDGYLTLRFRTRWGSNGVAHFVNLLTGINPDDPYEVEFRHNAYGDVNGAAGDALVAFRLSGLPDTGGETVKLTLRYQSFSGEKKITFDYCSRKSAAVGGGVEPAAYSSRVR